MKRTDWIIVGLRLIGAYVCLTGLVALVATAGLPKLPFLGVNVFRFSLGSGLTSLLLGGVLALYAARLGEWFERFDRGEVWLPGFGASRVRKGDAPRSDEAGEARGEPAVEYTKLATAASPEATRELSPQAPGNETEVPTWSSAARSSRRRKRGPFERLLTNSTPGRDAIQARRARRRKAHEQRRAADAGSESPE